MLSIPYGVFVLQNFAALGHTASFRSVPVRYASDRFAPPRHASFKLTIRQRIDMRCLEIICSGDKQQARTMVIRALREIANEIEEEGRKPRVRWDPKLKILLLNTD